MSSIKDSIPELLRAEYEERVLPLFGEELEKPEGAVRLCSRLRKHFTAEQASTAEGDQRVWELCGLFYLNTGRWHEAIGIFHDLYDYMLQCEADSGVRRHKGMTLCVTVGAGAYCAFPG